MSLNNGEWLGYVQRFDNQSLANLMDAGLALRTSVDSIRADPMRPGVRIEITLPLPVPLA